MATLIQNGNEEIQENRDHRSESVRNVVDLTRGTSDEVQDMEIETNNEQQTLNQAESTSTQPVRDENTTPDDVHVQVLQQNATPVVGRTVQVLESLPVNSPDEFQNKASKSSKTKSSKAIRSPLKSPEKDDDVSLIGAICCCQTLREFKYIYLFLSEPK